MKIYECKLVRNRLCPRPARLDGIDAAGSNRRVNAFLASHQKAAGEAKLTLVLFDHEYIVTHDGRPVNEVPALDARTHVPRGTTALSGRHGQTINTIGERLDKMPEAERPGKVIVSILIDGLENVSQEFSRQQVLEMIKRQHEVYSWEFIFLGANQDAIHAATQIGVLRTNAVTSNAAPWGPTQAFQAISCGTAAYRAGDADYAQHLSAAAQTEKDQAPDASPAIERARIGARCAPEPAPSDCCARPGAGRGAWEGRGNLRRRYDQGPGSGPGTY